jgi:hypothetical protein
MFAAPGQVHLFKHLLIHNVGAAVQRGQKAAPTCHRIQSVSVLARIAERGFNRRRSKLLLVKDRTSAELLHFCV